MRKHYFILIISLFPGFYSFPQNLQTQTSISESSNKLTSEIIFSATTNKNYYEYGDSIGLIYSIENPYDTTVIVWFNSSCQFDYYIDNYHYLDSIPCMAIGTAIAIPPESTRVFYFAHNNSSYIPEIGDHQFTGILVDNDTAATTYFKVIEPNNVNLDAITFDFELAQNFPNPFNPTTKINYSIPSVTLRQAQSDIHVSLKIYDILGKEIATLVNEEKSAGNYEVEFSVGQESFPVLPSNVYFYRLQAGTFIETKKMVLLK